MAQIYSIEELTNSINTLINSKYTGQILVKGEITNFKISRNNAFFGLKNENSFISCNYFQCYDVEDIQNGSLVVVTANVSIYSRFGKYNLNVSEIKPVGTGNIHQKYLEIKKKYQELGYFDSKNKKKIVSANKIGVVTAIKSAAINDFKAILEERNVIADVYYIDAIMQGSNSPSSVTKALSILDKMNLDVIVLTRGGGSFEDLFSFCHQDIIEEIYQSKTPIISAIGHEIDNVLSDNVADIRCPTPTHAAVYLATINCSNRNKIIYDASQKILDYKNTLVKLNQETNNLISGYNQSIEDKVNKYKILYDNYINSFKNKIISANKTVADLHDRLRANISYQDQSIKTLSQFKSLLESGSIETIKKMKISFIDGEANLYQLIKHYENKQKEIKENQK